MDVRGAATGGRFATVVRERRRLLFVLLAIGALALLVAACGGGSSTSSSSSPSASASTGESAEPTTLDATFATFPDYLDPALSYSLEGWTAMWETYVPLLTYKHAEGAEGAELIPGLARAMPKITDGGRTYTLFLRPGLRYSDGTPVRASDFGATIERDLAMNSPGTGFYTDIVGAEKFSETKKGKIGGIEADDKTGKITIHLVTPRGTFDNELAMLFAAPLPAGTPAKDLSASPPPGTGPYEIASSKPGDGWEYVRNPEWATHNEAQMPQIPSGNYDSIDVKVIANAETAVNEVENGKIGWMDEPPPPDRFNELRERYEGKQLLITPQIDIYYFWMNLDKAPFNNLQVRRAVNYAIDPAALERIYAGTMRPVQQVLPPAMPGHQTFRPYPHDMKKAKELIAAADPTQKKITVFGNSYGPNKQAAEYYEGVLRELGFEPTLKLVAPANYATVIGEEQTQNLDTGWAAWYIDYPHPNDYFAPQLSGESIAPINNTNYAHFDDPAINREIAKLDTEPLGPTQESAYAKLDREVMKQAPWAPFGSVTMTTFVSPEINLSKVIVSPVFGQDIATFSPN
jgi:peptide/nickel transport system substrate-binding protein